MGLGVVMYMSSCFVYTRSKTWCLCVSNLSVVFLDTRGVVKFQAAATAVHCIVFMSCCPKKKNYASSFCDCTRNTKKDQKEVEIYFIVQPS